MTATKKVLSADEAAASIEPLLKLASEHFASLALSAAVKLKLPDLIGDGTVTAAELAESLRSRGDADVVVDVACRDGRIPAWAVARFGARRAIGLEADAGLYLDAREAVAARASR